ncbi:hypothetical protein ALI22I_23285 [Saccharothrix sp. ALI-22-I]|uniref:hypothetical protein n=1 Tax=Saccharothrix sp. ALI-22-I TaxID=1933778 RepID=UPI00097BFDB9|nr:hypothetical protein [Saccharothrix sp. ALI-22-I]ONI87348.1 hypothetical protein ALI22I_23285 [Saccharothrix sp. ALI-22-I]
MQYPYIGRRFHETERLSVPQLARHLMDELPRQFGGLWFSATVYRYRADQPWTIDVQVFGVASNVLDSSHHSHRLMGRIAELIDEYNITEYANDVSQFGTSRFMGPNIVLLHEYEQGQYKPGRVSVRHYYITDKPRRLWEKVRSFFTGWLR